MRFIAELRTENLHIFSAILTALNKYSKIQAGRNVNAYMKFTPDTLSINVRHTDSLEAYVEVDMEEIFVTGFTLTSKWNRHIALSVDLSTLHTAVKMGHKSEKMETKLAVRDGVQVLSFEYNDPILQNLWLKQDCPIKTLHGKDIDHAGTPHIPVCEWNVELPKQRQTLLGVFDRLSKVGATNVSLDVSPDKTPSQSSEAPFGTCSLALNAASDLVSIKTSFRSLPLRRPMPKETEESVTRIFDPKKLSRTLRVSYDVSAFRSTEALSTLALPASLEESPWTCFVHSCPSTTSARMFCVVPVLLD